VRGSTVSRWTEGTRAIASRQEEQHEAPWARPLLPGEGGSGPRASWRRGRRAYRAGTSAARGATTNPCSS
jgi:hypothetical protein